jgi:NAD(P)-dependent dehydrogenase (short-subunit alcohol dehydrogenase family)
MSVASKVVVVTGAASGIGRAVALGFDGDGARVVGFDVNQAGLEETARMCEERMLSVVGDVCSEADIDRLVAVALERYSRIDVLFNNAGISDGGVFPEIAFERWSKTIQINLIGAALCIHRVLPLMLKQGYGRIINVASRAAQSTATRGSAYAASKAGLIESSQPRK